MLDDTPLKCKKLDLYLLFFFLSVEIGVKRRSRLIFPTQATRSLVICFNINMVACGHFHGRLSRPGACVPMVACRPKRLVACGSFRSLVILIFMVACRAARSSPCTFWEAGNFIPYRLYGARV